MTKSKIEWTDRSDWNPIRGCTRVSPGCGGPGPHGGCYAERIAARFSGSGLPFEGFARTIGGKARWTGKIELIEDRLMAPLRWKKPARIFACSMSDLFHEALPDEAIDRVFAVMALCPHHTFQVLTKRPERMRAYLQAFPAVRWLSAMRMIQPPADGKGTLLSTKNGALRNVWLGVSVEDQKRADERIPILLDTPAAVRWISAEPMLGPIDLFKVPGAVRCCGTDTCATVAEPHELCEVYTDLGWIICGGESGPGARPMHPGWARDLRDTCFGLGVPFLFKQWGEWHPHKPVPGGDLGGDVRSGRVRIVHPSGRDDVEISEATGGRSTEPGSRYMARVGKKRAGRLLDGVEHDGVPA